MAKTAKDKRITTDDVQARVTNEQFWVSRARWLNNDDDKSLARAIALNPPRQLQTKQHRKPQKSPQVALAIRILKELYPGGVPDTVSTKTAHAEVVNHCQRLGIKPPSYSSVARALGRRD
jgi:hypothetical protein